MSDTDKSNPGPSVDNATNTPRMSGQNAIAPSRRQVWKMFDRIADRYDLLNHLLSGNRDKAWRKKMAALLPDRSNLNVLDLATGTADQLLALYDSGRVDHGTGTDMAEKMLAIGRKKIEARSLSDRLTLSVGNAEQIPFDADTFDVASMSFGIRNMTDVPGTLREIHRVLKPEGRVLILEFSLPGNRLLKSLYLFYFRHILPRLGATISGDSGAYRYLNETVETFPYGEAFCRLMSEAGFRNVAANRLTFGIATIYQGDK
jgi:demethylmenaquinone methyltransferase/2-methoxy-6-polyprenyl-1,4-benzoquinol methylase